MIFVLAAVLAGAEDRLSVEQAVATGLAHHGAIEAGAEAKKAAGARIDKARGALLPQVTYREAWQRSDNQVFVFGSLLTQKQFKPANFDIGTLNDPGFLNNFQSQVVVDQSLYDNGRRKAQIRIAELGLDAAGQENRRAELYVISSVLRNYYSAVVAQASLQVAAEAVRSAEADMQRADAKRTAGLTTDADVLSIRVHVASMKERQIRLRYDVELARAALNQAMGVPLDTPYSLDTALTAASVPEGESRDAEVEALKERPELSQVRMAAEAGDQQVKAARAARLPEVFFHAGFEADRQRFVYRGGANWIVSAGVNWNVFNGFADRAGVKEAEHEAARVRAQARVVESATRLEVRRAWLDVQSAAQRIEVAQATVAMAEESLRIIKNRYEAGLVEVTELLRAETALLEARNRSLEAVRDQRLAAVSLEAARGKLTKDSDVVVR